ncbi:MAG: hypothetical protein ING73_11755 [Rhodocyclaceae bacterium]|nr:hypothetical protein [Rhodocyclaceae bacterium]MCA6466885.1 hypothetical protein [Chitinophagaceae bacterium]MCA3049815.1 hypothetical protein [Rhodocyclaceae bacterium]MCA3063854.1 hypothetical protein [Rhodocyclaceae bacterium]MCA3067583.1 hypothetical protein [Rhodocyclaceae bacterium]
MKLRFEMILLCFFANTNLSIAATKADDDTYNHENVKLEQSATTSWWSLRGRGMVVQTEDTTCGAASLATLLQLQTRKRWTEKEILERLPDRNRVSLASLEGVARGLNFRTRLASVNWETLARATSPVLLYFKSDDPQQVGHFVVLAGVNKTHALVLDPSWGRKTYSAAQLLSRWGLAEQNNEKGYILAVLPPATEPRGVRMQCDIANRSHALSVAQEATGVALQLSLPALLAHGANNVDGENVCK